jgi:hypothetical protein
LHKSSKLYNSNDKDNQKQANHDNDENNQKEANQDNDEDNQKEANHEHPQLQHQKHKTQANETL